MRAMASPAASTSEQEKYSLLIIGDVEWEPKLMSGIVNGFPQLVEPDSSYFGWRECNKVIDVDGRNIMLEIYSFERRYFDYRYKFKYQRANGIMIVYDVTHEESFEEVFKYSIREVDRYIDLEDNCLPIMLVGTNTEKRDKQIVSIERGRMRAEEIGLKARFTEVSHVTGENVETALQTITRDMIAYRSARPAVPEPESVNKHCVVS